MTDDDDRDDTTEPWTRRDAALTSLATAGCLIVSALVATPLLYFIIMLTMGPYGL